MAPARDIGIGVPLPTRECADSRCPFHGTLPVRGTILEGTVASDKMEGTVVIQREYLRFIRKFERYERRQTRMAAHNPPCIGARMGDRVVVAECRPLSKTKKFVVVRKFGEPGTPPVPAAASAPPAPATPPSPVEAPVEPEAAEEGEEEPAPEKKAAKPEAAGAASPRFLKDARAKKAKEPKKTKEAKKGKESARKKR